MPEIVAHTEEQADERHTHTPPTEVHA